jgi:hypothetical protein
MWTWNWIQKLTNRIQGWQWTPPHKFASKKFKVSGGDSDMGFTDVRWKYGRWFNVLLGTRISLPLQLIVAPWNRVFLEKLILPQLVKKLPILYGVRSFITVFTTAYTWSLPWIRWIQSMPFHYISLISILMLSYHLRQRLPFGLFLSLPPPPPTPYINFPLIWPPE